VRWLILAAVSLVQTSPAASPIDVSSLAVASPTSILELDRRVFRGTPSRLAWSPDGSLVYIESRDGVGAAARVRHYDMRIGNSELHPLGAAPDWADEYWHQKIAEAAPGMPWLMIDVRVDRDRQRVAPLAGGFVGTGVASGTDAATSVMLATVKLSFLDVEVGQWPIDDPAAGVTFGWGPVASGAIAFTDRQGRLVLLDKERRRRTVATTKDVRLPAWSPDGHHIVFLQRTGRAKYRLVSVALARADMLLQ
jgi:dipeptidyl aminopeptidase/acylaminoacyl peptidase